MQRLRLGDSDAELVQRVIRHVLEAQAEARLPQIRWHEGLHATEVAEILARWPAPTAAWDSLNRLADVAAMPATDLDQLLWPLRELLLAHRLPTDSIFTVVANTLTSACFGRHHLWQDLGATGRNEVSRLMALAFPALHASNVHDLRWKRHLFLVLGARMGRPALRPPKCDGCDDFLKCHGPPWFEGAPTWRLTPIGRGSRN